MMQNMMPLVVGGLVPALFFGVAGLMTKASMRTGIGTGMFLILFGIAEVMAGGLFLLFTPRGQFSLQGLSFSMSAGVIRGIGAGLVALAVVRFAAPISKLAPLYNTNTLVTVLLGLWLYAEWQEVNTAKLLLGSALVVTGTVLVGQS